MPAEDLRRSENFWFEDGNVILIANNGVGYRVHRGVLARHSQVFRDMLEFPQPPDSEESVDGCPVVQMTEHAEDLEDLLYVLYDGGFLFYNPNNALPLSIIAATLDLGMKFQIEPVRLEALRRLKICFPASLLAFHSGITPEGISTHKAQNMTNVHTTHPIKSLKEEDAIIIINLARKFDLTSLLPSAFYVCAQLPFRVLLKGAKDERGRTHELSAGDLELCLLLRDSLVPASLRQLSFLIDRKPDAPVETCDDVRMCTHLQRQVVELAYGDTGTQALAHPRALESWDRWLETLGFCSSCRPTIMHQYRARREAIWSHLGEFVGVSPWPPQEDYEQPVHVPGWV